MPHKHSQLTGSNLLPQLVGCLTRHFEAWLWRVLQPWAGSSWGHLKHSCPLLGAPATKQELKEWGLAFVKISLTCGRATASLCLSRNDPLRPNPSQGCLAMGNSVCLCWWSSTTNTQHLNVTNKDSCCTSTTAGHLCCHCHRNAFNFYTKGIANIQQPSKNTKPRLSSQLKWGIYALPYERQLLASFPAEQFKNLLYIHKCFRALRSPFSPEKTEHRSHVQTVVLTSGTAVFWETGWKI